MSFLKYSQVRKILNEQTSRCNLICPECGRNSNGKLNPMLHLGDITLHDYERIASPAFYQKLERIIFCGNYGDAVASPTFDETIDFLREYNVCVSIHTNGSLRSKLWWTNLAKKLDHNCMVIFSIDGLEDTNHLYRVHSNYNKILTNAKAFIDAGGVARWNFIEFDHNIHQIDQAIEIARDLGFKIFNIKKTTRHVKNKHYIENFERNVYDGDDKFKDILNKYGSWKNYINQTKISCYSKENQMIYIDYDLNLWPCCWIGSSLFYDSHTNIQQKQIFKLMERYGKGFNSLKHKTIKQVLNHPWFKNDLEESWNNTMDDDNFKMIYCGRTCGHEYKSSGCSEPNRTFIEL